MGSYREAVKNFLAGITAKPEITAHPLQTTIKYGFGANFEQPLNDWMGVFGRWGWNEGRHESFAYTEVDQTAQIGVGGNGKPWHRKFDRAGVVFVSNGILRDHQQYLALGGSGFLLGDGRLPPFMAFSRVFRFFLSVFAAIAFFSFAASAQTVDEVIARNIQAHGGVEKLKSVRSIRTIAKFSQGSFRAEFRQENKRADKVREELIIQGLAQVQAYDGKTGWQISPFGGRKDPELLSQDDLKRLVVDADIDWPLVDYKEKGHNAELVGHDSMEGTDCFKIRLSSKTEDVRYCDL